MKHSLAFALSLMLVSGTALADDRLISADVEKALEQSSAQMNKSVEQMNAAFEKVMPELARSMAQTMSQLLESITPVMQAMENNRTFSKASEQLSKDVARSVDELNLPNTKVEQGEFLTVKGSKTVNDNSLQLTSTKIRPLSTIPPNLSALSKPAKKYRNFHWLPSTTA